MPAPVSVYVCLYICSTRFVGKPEGVSNVFLTYFDNFFGESIQTWGLRGTRGVVNLPPPDKSSTLYLPLWVPPLVSVCVPVHGVTFINVRVVVDAPVRPVHFIHPSIYPSVHLSDLPGPYFRPSICSFSPSSRSSSVNPPVIRLL